MKNFSFITFLIMCSLLGLGLWIDSNNQQPTSILKKWTDLEKESIHRLTLKKDSLTIKFIKNTHGVWVMEFPEKIIANQVEIQKILQSVLQPDVHRILPLLDSHKKAIQSEYLTITCQFNKKKATNTYFRIPSVKQHYFILLDGSQKVLKVIDSIKFNPKISLQQFRTKRLFPFSLDSIKSFLYTYKKEQIYFENTQNNNWASNKVAGAGWQTFFSKLNNAACLKYKDGLKGGTLVASYLFNFQSKRKSLLELYSFQGIGFVAIYKGTQRGQVLSKETVETYFPKLKKVF